MKKILTSPIVPLIPVFLLLLTATAYAAPVPISVGTIEDIYVADRFISSSSEAACDISKTSSNCDFVDWNDQLINDAELADIVTTNPASFISRSAVDNGAAFDIGFDGFNLFNGEGDDLVLFIVGNGSSFGLDVFDTTGTNVFSDTYSVTASDTVFNTDNQWLCVNGVDLNCTNGYPLSAILIDFGDSLAGDVAVDSLHITLNDAEFALAGGFHITPVPLPLPVVLFSSGLVLLGWAARRKKV
jgi:hypothetical protein